MINDDNFNNLSPYFEITEELKEKLTQYQENSNIVVFHFESKSIYYNKNKLIELPGNFTERFANNFKTLYEDNNTEYYVLYSKKIPDKIYIIDNFFIYKLAPKNKTVLELLEDIFELTSVNHLKLSIEESKNNQIINQVSNKIGNTYTLIKYYYYSFEVIEIKNRKISKIKKFDSKLFTYFNKNKNLSLLQFLKNINMSDNVFLLYETNIY